MTPHLPYAFCDEDEFHHPVSGWLLMDRSITFDNWLSWRHALPGDRRGYDRLTGAITESIAGLAAAIHEVHQRLPGYQRLDRSPFVIPRWWDPFADDGWESGCYCLFRVDGCCGQDFLDYWEPERSVVNLAVVSESYLEASLLSTLPAGHAPRPPDSERRRSRAGRRTPRNPPPGRSAPAPHSPRSGP